MTHGATLLDTRRGDPERTYPAHRARIFARSAQNERVDELDAEHCISAWEREAEAQSLTRTKVAAG